MPPTTLAKPVTLSQAAVPVQVCYIVPSDAPADMLTAIFEECHNRWGGRDSLLIPIAGGVIDETYWRWAQALDPDVVYSYVDLDVLTLARIDRELMPSVLTIHRENTGSRFVPRNEVRALPSLSVLPMLANADRIGPPRRLALVSAFMDWPRNLFVTDSFGVNPFGPGWAQADSVRKHIATFALGSCPNDVGYGADAQVPDPTALLNGMWNGAHAILTMAQLSGTGYENLTYDRTSAWTRSFSIVVGDTSLDRIAFWNGRIGVDDYQRRDIVGLRLGEDLLEQEGFIDELAHFVARRNTSTSQNGPSFATIRSSSVSDERLERIASALPRLNVHVNIERFTSATECTPNEPLQRGFLRAGLGQRFTESIVPLVPAQPTHLVKAGPAIGWLSEGSWTIRVGLKREDNTAFGLREMVLPRRWQAVRAIAGAAVAKTAIDGSLRIIISGEGAPQELCFTDEDAQFIIGLFSPHRYLWTTDVREARLRKPAIIYPQISSAGRHLLGFLKRLRSLQAAYSVLGSQFWTLVFNEMALPREVTDLQKLRDVAIRLEKPIKRDGPMALTTDDEFDQLADLVARIAPDIKTPRTVRPYEWFVEMYRKTDESLGRQRLASSVDDAERQIQEEVEEQIRRRCVDGVLVQGYAWRCPSCLHQNWSTVEALARIVTCEVCERHHAVPARFSWSFLLDGYVSVGLRERGLRGLVWALGTLSLQSRHLFMFSPPLDLVADQGLLTDADIACVTDGKFVIGEVKESARNVTDRVGDRLIEVAELVRPDVILLACLERSSLPRLTKQGARIRVAVEKYGIEVRVMVPAELESGLMEFFN